MRFCQIICHVANIIAKKISFELFFFPLHRQSRHTVN